MTFAIGQSAPAFERSLDHLLAAMAYVDLRIRWAVARAQAAGFNANDEFRGLYISDEQVIELLGYEFGQHLWTNGHQRAATAVSGTAPGNGLPVATDAAAWHEVLADARGQWRRRTEASRQAGVSMTLDRLAQAFGLSDQELDALLIVLAPELDPRYERFFAYLQDDVTRRRPSVDLVLNLLTDDFQQKLALRRLFGADSRLQAARLVTCFEPGTAPEPTLLSHYVRPAGNVVEHLLGHTVPDTRLTGCARLEAMGNLNAPCHVDSDLMQHLLDARARAKSAAFFTFAGAEGLGKVGAARHLAHAAGQPLLRVNLARLATGDLGLAEGMTLMIRDGLLAEATLFLTGWDQVLDDAADRSALSQLWHYPHAVIVATGAEWRAGSDLAHRPAFTVQFERPAFQQRLRIWQTILPPGVEDAINLNALANHFRFTPKQIEDAAATAHNLALWRQEGLAETHLFAASRAHSNQNLAALATKIRPHYSWADIVLPADTLAQLKEMVNMVHQRPVVYGRWGFGGKLSLGKGLNSLFAGESGTGKTMAADIMAGELGLDLYKVDLSLLVSKYIGETEKNLDRIFTEAATSNAILFFDEADAIFGKRSEVKDSHDRYANIEISYLLQRMEAYDGVVILATNLRSNLDEAFTRRLHFAIEFPFPEAADRERIWRVNIPDQTPVAADVDFKLLAERFPLAGGNIRNIILAAAFLAADSTGEIGMRHLFHATRREYQKIGRLIDERRFA